MRTLRRRHLALSSLLSAVVGCSGGSSTTVVVDATNARLAAIRTGTSWQALVPDATGTVTVELDGPTVLATVCDNGTSAFYLTLATGPGEEDELDMSCFSQLGAATITLAAPVTTKVFVGSDSRTGGNALHVPPGTYDVVAVDLGTDPARIEIRRGVAVTGDTTLAFDLAATGTPMVRTRIDVTPTAGGETVSRGIRFETANGTRASWSTPGADGWIVPAALLVADDNHHATASTSNAGDDTRSAQRRLHGTESTVALALPPYLAAATPTVGVETSLAWQGDARFDELVFLVHDGNFATLWGTYVRPAWSDAGGETSSIAIPDPHAIPGWSSAWDLAATDWIFQASHETDEESFSASRTGEL